MGANTSSVTQNHPIDADNADDAENPTQENHYGDVVSENDHYCALCGVAFDVFAGLYRLSDVTDQDVAWTNYCISVWAELDEIHLSGIADYCISLRPPINRIPPTAFDSRLRPEDETIDVDLWEQGTAYHGELYGDITSPTVAYPMHVPCWKILQQQIAQHTSESAASDDFIRALGDLFASQTKESEYRGLHPDWCEDYDGAEQFWRDGWTYTDDVDASETAGFLEVAPEWDYIVFDPDYVPNWEAFFSKDFFPRKDDALTRMDASSNPGNDPMQTLPEELRHYILGFLPSSSVRAARLAFRSMSTTSLSKDFWRSRFDYPHEFWHLVFPGWYQYWKRIDGNQAIDGPKLYCNIKHLTALNSRNLQNRQRISSLCRQLVFRLIEQYRLGQNNISNPSDTT